MAAHNTDMSPSQPRQPRGNTTAGQYAAIDRPEPTVTLDDGVYGWQLKRFRIIGHGTASIAWHGVLTFAGVERITVNDPGDGTPAVMTPMDDSAAVDFTRTAKTHLGDELFAAAQLLDLLRTSHEIDDEARTEGVDRASIIALRVDLGLLEEDDAEHLR